MLELIAALLFSIVPLAAFFAFQWWKTSASRKSDQKTNGDYVLNSENRRRKLEKMILRQRASLEKLKPFEAVAKADEHVKNLLSTAHAQVAKANDNAHLILESAQLTHDEKVSSASDRAQAITTEARFKLKTATEQAASAIAAATQRSTDIVAEAKDKAEKIAGKAYDAVENADRYEKAARAMKNIVDGYGNQYLIPAENLLDDLAEDFSHKEAGQQLKLARKHTKAMVTAQQASTCKYVEVNRRQGAERFVLDAYNGKIDSVLSRVRHDNHGKLQQELDDAVVLVNNGGKPFRDAQITPEYHASRREELRWGVLAFELKKKEQEEQRQIRDQIREEEKARRDYEKAIREAMKEEKLLRKLMTEAEARVASATAEERAAFEKELGDLSGQLREAEERNLKAVSMAELTRRGHVYIISNIGSFGEGVVKVGLTRRLEPLDRIKELSDASVPFSFDVHAMIFSDDAPALETMLHKHLVLSQVNKVNHRKEFFRSGIADLRKEIESLNIATHWTMAAEAQEYRETLAIEKMIDDDPATADAWANRQLKLETCDQGRTVGVKA